MTINELLNVFGMQSESWQETPVAMFHLHTRWSHDSKIEPEFYLDFAKKRGVNLLCITDHGTTKGAKELARHLADAGLEIHAPIGMEAYAKEGHLGCIGIQEDIKARLAHDIVSEVRAQGGVSVYNHPYQYGRTADMKVAELVDFIEYPNNRTSPQDNYKALQLAIELKKPVLPGADVHQQKELFYALVHLIPSFAGQGLLASPLPDVRRNYYDKVSEVWLKTVKSRKPDYVISALRHLVRKAKTVKHGVL